MEQDFVTKQFRLEYTGKGVRGRGQIEFQFENDAKLNSSIDQVWKELSMLGYKVEVLNKVEEDNVLDLVNDKFKVPE